MLQICILCTTFSALVKFIQWCISIWIIPWNMLWYLSPCIYDILLILLYLIFQVLFFPWHVLNEDIFLKHFTVELIVPFLISRLTLIFHFHTVDIDIYWFVVIYGVYLIYLGPWVINFIQTQLSGPNFTSFPKV